MREGYWTAGISRLGVVDTKKAQILVVSMYTVPKGALWERPFHDLRRVVI